MLFVRKYGWAFQLFWKPIRDVLQRWRLSLASLVFFTIFLTNNFGLTTSLGLGIGVVEAAGTRGVPGEKGEPLHPNAIGVSGAGPGQQTQPGLSKSNYIAPSSSSTQTRRKHLQPQQDNISYKSRTSSLKEYFLELLNATALVDWAAIQCLVLDSDIAEQICSQPASGEKRTQKMRSLNLKFCNNFPVYYALDKLNCNIEETTETECRKCFEELEKLDLQAYAMFCPFRDLLSKYNCENKFSTHWTCSDCKEAYKNWVCAMTVPYYNKNSQRIQPCQKYCELVENRCPYFQPHRDSQYAGEPSFLCRDLDESFVQHSEDGHSSHSGEEGELSLMSVAGAEGPCHYPCVNGTRICETKDNSTLDSQQSKPSGGDVLLTQHFPPGQTRDGEKTQTYTALTPGANSTGPHQTTSSGALSSVFQCSTQPRTLSFLQNNQLLIVAQLAFLLWHIWTLSIQSLYRVIGLT